MRGGVRDGDALNLYGNVDIREVQLAFRQSGRVAQMLFDEGDHVEPGAHMATLDAQPFEEALAAADAAVAAAQADLDKLRRGLRPQEIAQAQRSEEHTSELQSLMRISYAVLCLKKKK